MKCLAASVALLAALSVAYLDDATGAEPATVPVGRGASRSAQVYGEWRIQIRPDKGNDYARLIETEGLPLFREAGGRMVGWWSTLVGDLYEQVTIWQYDDMAGFEQAVQKLGSDKRFAEFVAARDPLLAGEQNRFLRLTDFAVDPALAEQSKVVVHEVHRVPLARREDYLRYMRDDGLALLAKHGFRPAGPWVVDVGRWTEVTYLFRFDSLREREKLIASFAGQADASKYGGKISEYSEEVTNRILLPAKFAHPPADGQP